MHELSFQYHSKINYWRFHHLSRRQCTALVQNHAPIPYVMTALGFCNNLETVFGNMLFRGLYNIWREMSHRSFGPNDIALCKTILVTKILTVTHMHVCGESWAWHGTRKFSAGKYFKALSLMWWGTGPLTNCSVCVPVMILRHHLLLVWK